MFQGDSGGPLIAERKYDKRYELIGNEYRYILMNAYCGVSLA